MRTLRPRLIGLLSCLLILAIVTGLPLVLFAVGANPLTIVASVPSLDQVLAALLNPDDGRLLVTLIKGLAWLAWATLATLILVEIVAVARGIQAPRLPGLRVPQHAARSLVGAALLLFVTLPATTVANAAPTPPVAAATQTPRPSSSTGHTSPAHANPSARTGTDTEPSTGAPARRTIEHTVRPGESLWSIAQDKLGDGRKYHELVVTNADLLNGKPGFIKPGWVLTIELPRNHHHASPSGPRTVTVEKGDTLSSIAEDELGNAGRYPEIFRASRGIEQPHGEHLTDPDEIDVGWTLNIPSKTRPERPAASQTDHARTPASAPSTTHAGQPPARPTPPTATASAHSDPAPPAARGTQTGTVEQQEPTTAATPTTPDDGQLQEEPGWLARTAYGVGALLAAGVVVLIARRRSTQQRRRHPGQKMPLPAGRAAEVEQQLRVTADALSIETVDVALRALAHHCATSGTPLPKVRAARLTATQFDLYLAEPAQLPSPWAGTADTTVWSLPVDNTDQLDRLEVSTVPAPYPSLVTIGHDDEDGHVLLDLEHLGSLGVTGTPSDTAEVFAAIAIELATSAWADDIQVTLIGAFPELEDTLQTGRIRYLPSVGHLLDDLEHRAAVDRQAFADAAADDLHAARIASSAPDSWAPEIVLVSTAATERHRTQIHRIIDDLPRVAMAFVTSGDPMGEWNLQLTADPDRAILAPIDLQLRPQRIPAEQYADLLHLAALADIDELTDAPADEPPLAEVTAIGHTDNESPRQQGGIHVEQIVTTASPPHAKDATATDLTFATIPTDPPAPTERDRAGDAALDEEPLAPGQPATATTADPAGQQSPAAPAAPLGSGSHSQPSSELSAGPAARQPDPAFTAPSAPSSVESLRLPAPRINVLGPTEMVNATGKVEPSKRARLLEFAAYLALNPGATHVAIDNAIWPDRKTEDNLNTRNPATSKLRRWVGTDPDGQEYLPRHQAGGGYGFVPDVTTDAGEWDGLLRGDARRAPTENLEAALRLVRGIPFEGTHPRRYAWAEPIKQRLISEIVDVAYELGRRRLMSGQWRAAEEALVIALRIEPAQENLWRLRILAAHESRNSAAETEAIDRLLTITEQLECELEPETEQLIAALKKPGSDLDQLLATAL